SRGGMRGRSPGIDHRPSSSNFYRSSRRSRSPYRYEKEGANSEYKRYQRNRSRSASLRRDVRGTNDYVMHQDLFLQVDSVCLIMKKDIMFGIQGKSFVINIHHVVYRCQSMMNQDIMRDMKIAHDLSGGQRSPIGI